MEEVKEKLLELSKNDHESYIKAILSVELNIEDEDFLDNAYDQYISNDDLYLISEHFYDMQNEYQEELESER